MTLRHETGDANLRPETGDANLRHEPGATLGDGLLARYLHGELDGDAARALAAHLSACDACCQLAASIEARARRVREALQDAAFDEPRPAAWEAVRDAVRSASAARRRAARFRIAAGLLLAMTAAAAAASPPVRAWIARSWTSLVHRETPPPAVAPVPAAIPAATPAGAAALSFRASGPVVDVVLNTTQAGGTLAARFTAGEQVVVSVDDGGGEHVTWSGDVVRIANLASSNASYTITLPDGVDRLRIRVGARRPIEMTRDAVGADVVRIEMDSGAPVGTRRVRNRSARDAH